VAFVETEKLTENNFDIGVLKDLKDYFERIRQYNMSIYNNASKRKDALISQFESQMSTEEFNALKKNNYNESTEELLKNTNSAERILVDGKNIVQKFEPVFMETPE